MRLTCSGEKAAMIFWASLTFSSPDEGLVVLHMRPLQEGIDRPDVDIARPRREASLSHPDHPSAQSALGQRLKISPVAVKECPACVVVAVLRAWADALQVLPFLDELFKRRFHCQQLISAAAPWALSLYVVETKIRWIRERELNS